MKFLHKRRVTIFILICLFLLIRNVHSIFSSDNTTNDKQISTNAFFNHLSNLKDPFRFIKVIGTFERLKQLTLIQDQLRLQPDQRQIAAQEHQELLINLYRQLFGLSKYYNIEKDLTASEVINSLLQHFTPDELLDQLQSNLPSPDDIIAPRQPGYHERFAGFVTFTNIIWFISISLFVYSLTVLFKISIFPLILEFIYWIPVSFWEFLAHIICLFIIFNARIYDVGTPRRDYIALTGCIIWAPLWLWSFKRRTSDYDKSYRFTTRILFVIYAFVAIQYQINILGTLTIYLLLSVLGFSGHVYETMAFIGFDSRNSLVRCKFVTGLLLLAFSIPTYIFNKDIYKTKLLAPFENGISFFCTLTYHVALLIDSTNYKHWNLILEIFSYASTLWCGTVYNVLSMKSIGGTFLVWWFFVQMGRINWLNVRVVWLMLLLSFILWKLCYVIQSYPDYFFNITHFTGKISKETLV
ncbi:hypothetical protein F8M41_019400 [Gigaspora margarita]|uniref:Acyltransferase 3 domain-containing protein n=1 Tax=Gigaspora margarita TaxID=4874 RepID=A0A8H4B2C6_GIGMA|nr:hypothetical protein F8M41_019400 [Gigaspora margarita]